MANDKNCLVARSRCHLALGDTRKALTDAEASLSDDKTFHKVKQSEHMQGIEKAVNLSTPFDLQISLANQRPRTNSLLRQTGGLSKHYFCVNKVMAVLFSKTTVNRWDPEFEHT